MERGGGGGIAGGEGGDSGWEKGRGKKSQHEPQVLEKVMCLKEVWHIVASNTDAWVLLGTLVTNMHG